MTVLIFELGDQLYALPLNQVRHVEPVGRLDPIPLAPSIFAGAMCMRGRVVPVLDLAQMAGIASGQPRRVLVLDPSIADLGLLVGATRGRHPDVHALPPAQRQELTATFATPLLDGDQCLNIINLEDLLLQLDRSFPG